MREIEEGDEPEQASEDAGAPGEADPATIALARRAYEAVLAGNRPALDAISQSMEPAPAAAPWPGTPMPAHPARHGYPASGAVVSGKKASSGALPAAIAAGALLVFAGAGGDEDLQVLSQSYAQRYPTTTILAFKNTLDWASADDATVSCSATLLGPPEKPN